MKYKYIIDQYTYIHIYKHKIYKIYIDIRYKI